MENRINETANLYANPEEVDAFARSAKRGLVGSIEWLFVHSILRDYSQFDELSILDVGTGPGWIPIKLSKMKPTWKITAVDQSHLMLERAEKQSLMNGAHVNWILGNAEKTGLEDNSFDLVISHFALHEFDNLQAVLQEMLRVVKEKQHIRIQDLARPQSWMMPMLRIGMLAGHPLSPKMRRQGRESLQAAYTATELALLAAPLNHRFHVRWNPFLFTVQLDIEKIAVPSPLQEETPAEISNSLQAVG